MDAIVDRVGTVVAAEALAMLGEIEPKRVIVIVGPGLNGRDGLAAAAKLADHGVGVKTVDAVPPADSVTWSNADLIIDGAFGIGLSRPFVAPDTASVPVLAIDIASGIHGETGLAMGTPVRATRTITLGGYKAGLLFGDGPDYSGDIVVADIGLDSDSSAHLIEAGDVRTWLPVRPRNAHKWNSALLVVAGSPGMTGAARLATASAMRAGAGYVHLITRAEKDPGLPSEVVSSRATDSWPEFEKFRAAVVGPGLARSHASTELVRAMLETFEGPLVIDGDGLSVIAANPGILKGRNHLSVLTPHDGEFERLAGRPPGPNRMEAARELASVLNSVVLLKGPATVIASPAGNVRVSNTGNRSLSTAGTGDVLAGIIGALLAQGVAPFDAAGAAAFVHGKAAGLGPPLGLIASDLCDLIPRAMQL